MRLLLVRHAPAGDRAAFAKTGRPDALRPLTAKGRRKMERAAEGLKRILPEAGPIVTSPLKRAVETGRILARAYGGLRELRLSELSPASSPKALLKRLRGLGAKRTPLLIGHEPHLGTVLDYLATGGKGLKLSLKKGGACLVEFTGLPRPGAARLVWALTPGQLRRLGA